MRTEMIFYRLIFLIMLCVTAIHTGSAQADSCQRWLVDTWTFLPTRSNPRPTLEIKDSKIYFPTRTELYILDINSAGELSLDTTIYYSFQMTELSIVDDICFFAGDRGIGSFDISELLEPIYLDCDSGGYKGTYPKISDSLLIVKDGSRFHIYNISDPEAIVYLGQTPFVDMRYNNYCVELPNIFCTGDYRTGIGLPPSIKAGISIFDISNLDSITSYGPYWYYDIPEMNSMFKGIAKCDSFLYVLGGYDSYGITVLKFDAQIWDHYVFLTVTHIFPLTHKL